MKLDEKHVSRAHSRLRGVDGSGRARAANARGENTLDPWSNSDHADVVVAGGHFAEDRGSVGDPTAIVVAATAGVGNAVSRKVFVTIVPTALDVGEPDVLARATR